jgi:hypothetical protein
VQILVRNTEEKRQLKMPRRRTEDNIKIDLREIIFWKAVWIHLIQEMETCENDREHSISIKYKTFVTS